LNSNIAFNNAWLQATIITATPLNPVRRTVCISIRTRHFP